MMTDLVKEHPADDNITRNLNSVEWLRYLLDDLIHHELNPGGLSAPSSAVSAERNPTSIPTCAARSFPSRRNCDLGEYYGREALAVPVRQ